MASGLLTSSRLFLLNPMRISSQLWPSLSIIPARFLYCKESLGIDSFLQQKQHTKNQMANISARFKEKMESFTSEDSKSMVFTEDLKNMVFIAEDDGDIELVVKMMKKFNQQNKELRFGSFVFGPVVMRLFHFYNKPDIALDCFKSADLAGFFDQLISYQLLMDLLYENARYNDVLDVYKIIRERQIEQTRFPKNAVVLALAASYKLNSKKSLEFALNLWKEITEAGHYPMRRATTFCAALALNQGQPEIALEVLTAARNTNYTTVRNIKVAALTDVGRVEDAIPILKTILTEDLATDKIHTFNRDILNKVKDAIGKVNNPDLTLEFNKLEKIFENEGHIVETSLDQQLCSEIQKPPVMNNRQENRYSRYQPRNAPGGQSRVTKTRPGLRDLL